MRLRTGPRGAQGSVFYNLVAPPTHEHSECLPDHQSVLKTNVKCIKTLPVPLELFAAYSVPPKNAERGTPRLALGTRTLREGCFSFSSSLFSLVIGGEEVGRRDTRGPVHVSNKTFGEGKGSAKKRQKRGWGVLWAFCGDEVGVPHLLSITRSLSLSHAHTQAPIRGVSPGESL